MSRVGVIMRDYQSKSGNDLLALRKDLITYLNQYDIEIICIPVIFDLPIAEELERVERIIKTCDGIILPGGEYFYDIDLAIVQYLYDIDLAIVQYLYDIDLAIVQYLYDNNIPTLGICLGMQMMSVAMNGDIERLDNLRHQSKEEYVHPVKIKPNSKLYTILKDNEILVNSRHIEHITTTDLAITAIADDLTIEAVEDKEKQFFIGVQWHPESLINDIYSKRLFDYFISCL